ncbi:SDR family NAD(P)-dependent oxidoreductase [Thioalkalivibrio sp. HK1]|uniref:SDR family NAD(P)-dependent oxidoreductase n=1 Tax=Thioalkalivibrio sp. HK1 TaxID=1469245 RepID=UPI0018CC3941|nr:SDR family NAD(P)-dependent oxidoreductase [Thioalkalivibrio sp. HK1]
MKQSARMLEGKVALVTGAGRGIGAQSARMLAAYGAKVLVNDPGGSASGEGQDRAPAGEVVDAIRKEGGEADANFDSVADFAAASRMVEQAIDRFGTIDIVIANAGILRDAIFHKMSEEDFDAVIGVHLKGAFNVARAAATHFRARQSGCFVFMTSTSGLIGNLGQANYAAAKMGIVGLSKSIALDMERFNVRSNCISPFAWSRMIGTIPVEDEAQRARVDKLKQMRPEKVAAMVVALCSDQASKVNGQIFAVRGNEIFLMSQSRPRRGIHEARGWSPESIIDHAFPALAADFHPLDRSADVFGWDPL